jgi:glycosyltransferase involved in cell wall biosynthesis
MTPPRVAIIIPCYNVAEYLPAALASVAAQTMQDFECVAINDGSTDDTTDAFERCVYRMPQDAADHFSLIEQYHAGLAAAVLMGATVTAAPRLMYMGGDDTLDPRYLAICLAAMDLGGTPVAYTPVEENGLLWAHYYGDVPLVESNCIPGCAVMDRALWDFVGGFPAGFPHGCEDWGMWVIAERMGLFAPVPPALVEGTVYHHRLRDGSLTSQLAPHMPAIRKQIAALARGEEVAP